MRGVRLASWLPPSAKYRRATVGSLRARCLIEQPMTVLAGRCLTFIDITERRQAVETLRALQEEQASDLAATLKLQELSSSVLNRYELQPLLRQLLDATIEMQGADFGCVQLYNAARNGTSRWLHSAVSIRRF